jgi:hypothetical protein
VFPAQRSSGPPAKRAAAAYSWDLAPQSGEILVKCWFCPSMVI